MCSDYLWIWIFDMDNSILTIVIILVLSCIGLILFAIHLDQEEQKKCAALGGHIIEKGSVGVGPTFYGNQPGVATTYNSVTFCVSQDGRILF